LTFSSDLHAIQNLEHQPGSIYQTLSQLPLWFEWYSDNFPGEIGQTPPTATGRTPLFPRARVRICRSRHVLLLKCKDRLIAINSGNQFGEKGNLITSRIRDSSDAV